MQAIRVLRAQSRPASPSSAPSLTPLSDTRNATAHGGTGHTEDPHAQHRSTPLSRIQNMTPFAKRSTHNPTPPPTPPISGHGHGHGHNHGHGHHAAPSTIVQDGTYLNTLGLKLNEAATKALATSTGSGPDSFKGRKPLPAGRGRYFASLVETELDASQSNPNLRHAILRLLPRSLSVIIASLSTQVSTMLSTPGFVPSSVIVPLHPSTVHALALAQFIAELLETFTTYNLGKATAMGMAMGMATPELVVARNNLEALINRITGPLLSQVQSEMGGLLEQLGNLPNEYGKPNPAVVALGQYMPSFSRALRRCTFMDCSGNQNMLATFLISTVWQAFVHLAHRTPPRASTTPGASGPSTPSPKFSGLSPLLKAGGLTPPSSPPKKKRVLTLPEGSPQLLPHKLRRVPSATDSSRSISPAPGFDSRSQNGGGGYGGYNYNYGYGYSYGSGGGANPVWMLWLTSLAADARAIYELFSDNETGLGAVRPVEGSLPREAVDEALERFAAFKDWLSSYSGLRLIESVPEEVPLLIALPVILTEAWSERRLGTGFALTATTLNQMGQGQGQVGQSEDGFSTTSTASTGYSGMAKLVGYESEDVYRRCVLSGFGKADEWAIPVARCVLDRLRAMSASSSSSTVSTVSTTSTTSASSAASSAALSQSQPFVFSTVTPNVNGEWSTKVIKWLEERVDGDGDGDVEMSG